MTKARIIIGLMIILLAFGLIFIFLYDGQPAVKSQEHSDSRVMEEIQKPDNPKPVSEPISAAADDISDNEKDKLTPENKQEEVNKTDDIKDSIKWLDSLKTETPIEEKDPKEILKKYTEVFNSQEFRTEARNILISSRKVQLTHMKIIKELEDKLKNAPAEERDSIQNSLWEAKVDLRKEIIVQDDNIRRLYLKKLTVEEISIARQELKKTSSRSLFSGASEGDPEELKALNEEAMRRLKADGWVPSMPDNSY